jgi:hypothetical protein
MRIAQEDVPKLPIFKELKSLNKNVYFWGPDLYVDIEYRTAPLLIRIESRQARGPVLLQPNTP